MGRPARGSSFPGYSGSICFAVANKGLTARCKSVTWQDLARRDHATRDKCLEKRLRNLDPVARLQFYVLGRVLAKLADIEDGHLATAQQPDALLVGEIVK